MAPTIPVAATDVSGTGTTLAGAGEAETSGTSDKVLGIAVLFWYLLGERDDELLRPPPELQLI